MLSHFFGRAAVVARGLLAGLMFVRGTRGMLLWIGMATCLAGSVFHCLNTSSAQNESIAAPGERDPLPGGIGRSRKAGATPALASKTAVRQWLETVGRNDTPGSDALAAAFEPLLREGDPSGLTALDKDAVRALAREWFRNLPKAQIAAALEQTLGLPQGALEARSDPIEVVVELVEALTGRTTPAPQQSVVVVMDDCAPDGRSTGVAHVIPAGTRRVYAAFENKRSLRGLNQLLAIWRQLGDERLVFTETEPIHAGSRYNYVWLELEEGWPAGRYRVDLFDPVQPSRLLASEAFRVR